tara:strand:- start:64903 stop:65874 length:972 start_codon:yes stop_codon:yes gene_type:complete
MATASTPNSPALPIGVHDQYLTQFSDMLKGYGDIVWQFYLEVQLIINALSLNPEQRLQQLLHCQKLLANKTNHFSDLSSLAFLNTVMQFCELVIQQPSWIASTETTQADLKRCSAALVTVKGKTLGQDSLPQALLFNQIPQWSHEYLNRYLNQGGIYRLLCNVKSNLALFGLLAYHEANADAPYQRVTRINSTSAQEVTIEISEYYNRVLIGANEQHLTSPLCISYTLALNNLTGQLSTSISSATVDLTSLLEVCPEFGGLHNCAFLLWANPDVVTQQIEAAIREYQQTSYYLYYRQIVETARITTTRIARSMSTGALPQSLW